MAPAPAHARELQAAPAEIGHGAFPDRQGLERGERPEAGFLATRQHAHLDALPPPERLEEAIPVERVSDRRRRHRDHARPRAISDLAQEAMHRPKRRVHRLLRKMSARAASEAGLDPLLPEDAEADALVDAGQKEPGGVRAQVDERDQLRHGRSVGRAGSGQITGMLREAA